MAGVTNEGFVRPSVQELLSLIETDQRNEIAQDLVLGSETPEGQINGIVSRHLGIAWEALEAAYNAFDPDRAEGAALTSLAKLTGTQRAGATYSTVPAEVDLDIGTTLEAGTHYAHVQGQPLNRWTPQADFTAPSSGLHTVAFRAESAGPVAAVNGTISVIATPLVGWNSVENTADATPGNVADSDATLRIKRDAQLSAAGSSAAAAIRADVLQIGPWVRSVSVFENETASIVDGIPPHAFEVLVHLVNEPADAADQIAQAIWETKPAGIKAHGSTSGNATNSLLESVPVGFTIAEDVPIYVTITAKRTDPTLTPSLVAEHVASAANARFAVVGEDVVALYVESLPLQIPGITDVTFFRIGTSPAPSAAVNVPIGNRQLARFDSSNVAVTLTT